MEQFGWFAYYVPGSPDYPNKINYHTHGVPESFGHLDLQICLPIRLEHSHSIFTTVINNIKEGQIFIEDKAYHKVLAKYHLTFVLAFEEEGMY